MKISLIKLNRSILAWLTVAFVANLVFATTVLAGSYKANDAGNDNPDGANKWFAPTSSQHDSAWWDEDGAGISDQVVDQYMVWSCGSHQEWVNNPTYNYIHEVRTGNTVYEADSWYWTNLVTPNHNEDSIEAEEWADGYEEKELGWDNPANQIPACGAASAIQTSYAPLNNGNTYFEVESELTDPGPWGGGWYPINFDVLGRMDIVGAQ